MKYIFNIFCFILITSNSFLSAQSPINKIRFNNLNAAKGLPQNTINCVIQDKKGMLWFGTSDGLNRYDGYTFKVYKNELGNKNSLSNNYVLSLLEDSKGYIWVGTYGGGLNRLDPDTDTFVRFQKDRNNPNSLFHDDVRNIYEDKEGILWICTYGGDFNSYNPKTQTFRHYNNTSDIEPADPYRLYSAVPDKDKGFWLCGEQGLFYFDKRKKRYTKIFKIQPPKLKKLVNNFIYDAKFDKNQPHILWLCTFTFGLIQFNTLTDKIEKRWVKEPGNPNTLNSGSVWSIHWDKNNHYWVGTRDGFHHFNPKTGKFIRYLPNAFDKHSIAGRNIQKVFEDNAGTIWLCTFDRGISSFHPYLNNFTHYNEIEKNQTNRVGAFCEDKDGKIWIGMGRGTVGLACFDRKKRTFQLFKPDPNNPQSIASKTVNTLLADVDGTIWIGTIGAGLDHYNPKTKTFEHFPPDKKRTGIYQNSPHIGSLYQDPTKPDELWVGTRGSGLFLFDKKSKTYVKRIVNRKKVKGPKITHNTVIDITKDHKGHLWVATRKGLNHINLKTTKITQFLHSSEDLTSLSGNYVTSLHVDKQQVLWVGTRNGINRLDLKQYYQGNTEFKHYNTKHGLPNDVIHSIVEDKQGHLWLSTNNGISRFDKQKQSFKNYDEQDGLQAKEFATGGGLTTRDGTILMGGVNGFNIFSPNNLKTNNYKPRVILTDFQIFNQSVPVTKNGILKQPIWATDTIELSHEENVISFEFAALSYIFPEHNTYTIKMEKFDKDWRFIGRKNFETYTSLPAGTYVFRIKSSNNDGIMSDKETKLVIIVHPPWWETWWFRISLSLFVIGLLITGYRIRITAIKKQKRLLEAQVKERTFEIRETNEELQQTNEELQTTLSQVKEKNVLIQEFNENITESINYAQIIQNDMLPSQKEIKHYLPESFIFYQPRDVVSGDFYWFATIEDEGEKAIATTPQKNADKIIMVVADCTGHGVPGAFMSIKGAVLLNQIVNFQGITSPEAILQELNQNIRYSLSQDKTSNRDGIDIGIVLIDFKKQQLEFAGAKNSLLFIQEGRLYEIKGHILPVGGYHEYPRNFEKKVIPLTPNTQYYLTSDGFTDQFGGPQGKKFLKSRFKSLLLDMHQLPMQEQYQIVQKTFLDWKGNLEQVDDILVMGITI